MAHLTSEEKAEYNKLTYAQQKKYDLEREMDPTLTHKEVILIIGLNKKATEIAKSTGGDVDINEPGIQKKLFEGLRDFLKNFPDILAQVGYAIDRTIDYLGELLWKGIDVVVDLADSIWDFFKRWF